MSTAAAKIAELSKVKPRVKYEYTVPPSVSEDIKTFAIHELTSDDELMATKRSRNEVARLAYELAKASLAEVNGKPVSLGDGSADKAWDDMPPKLRSFVTQAYAECHVPSDEETADFRKSRRVKVS